MSEVPDTSRSRLFLFQLGTSYVTGNPLITNPTTDFSLRACSPATDVGSTIGAPSTDYTGITRPQGSGYDIGAYEYTGPYYHTFGNHQGRVGSYYYRGTLKSNLTGTGSANSVTVGF